MLLQVKAKTLIHLSTHKHTLGNGVAEVKENQKYKEITKKKTSVCLYIFFFNELMSWMLTLITKKLGQSWFKW